MAAVNCSVCAQQKRETQTGLGQLEGELVLIYLNLPFKHSHMFLLVMPGDVQLVVVVADEGVKPDALLCALDLQMSGRVRWTERKHAAKTRHLHTVSVKIIQVWKSYQ